MNKIYYPLLLLLLITLTYADQEVPLQKGGYGFSVGDKDGHANIQFFLDFLCPDSKNSYNVIVEVMKAVDFTQQGIKLTYQFEPLSWHFYAFKIHQAFFYILNNHGQGSAQKFISYVFANQDDFAEQKYLDKTISAFLDQFVDRIATIIKVDKAAFRAELNKFDTTWNQARYHWKYAIGSNAVAFAPIFNLNSVRIDGAEQFRVNDWINLLQKYKLAKPAKKHISIDDFYNKNIVENHHK